MSDDSVVARKGSRGPSEAPSDVSTLDAFFAASTGLRHLANDLRGLANSFANTGNDKAADRLWDWADTADDLSKTVINATTLMVEKNLSDSRQATSNMLGLAVALLDRPAIGNKAEGRAERPPSAESASAPSPSGVKNT